LFDENNLTPLRMLEHFIGSPGLLNRFSVSPDIKALNHIYVEDMIRKKKKRLFNNLILFLLLNVVTRMCTNICNYVLID